MVKRIFLIAAAVLIVAGLALFVVTMATNGWDFSLLDYAKRETVTHEVREDFNLIQIDTDTADITILPSEDGACRVICDETTKETYSVTVENETLVIRKNDQRAWYEFFDFGRQGTLTVYLPKPTYVSLLISESTGNVEIPRGITFDSVDIAASTGDITVADVSAGSVAISVSTGKVRVSGVTCDGDLSVSVSTGRTELEGVRCRNLTSTGSTGKLVMKDVIVSEKLSVERSTGDVKFDSCDAGEIYVKTSTGDVTGTLRSAKIFFPKTDTGEVFVPQTVTGGQCTIITDTGDIRIEIG